MEGLLLIDKPAGITSFDVVAEVRDVVDEGTVGHMGTLDREATGLLALMIGRCTKLQKYLGEKVSVYEFAMHFGEQTDTLDDDGEVVAECDYDHVGTEAIRQELSAFVGTIEQAPPKYSAIKIDGRRASDWARDEESEDVEPEAREVEIRQLELLEFEPPVARFRIECVSGTYVRSVVRDLAAALDTCGYASDIRRVASYEYDIGDAVELDELDEETARAHLLSPNRMVAGLPAYEMDDEEERLVSYGTQFDVPEDWLEARDLEEGDAVRLVDGAGELAAVARLRRRYGELEFQPRRVLKPAQEQ